MSSHAPVWQSVISDQYVYTVRHQTSLWSHFRSKASVRLWPPEKISLRHRSMRIQKSLPLLRHRLLSYHEYSTRPYRFFPDWGKLYRYIPPFYPENKKKNYPDTNSDRYTNPRLARSSCERKVCYIRILPIPLWLHDWQLSSEQCRYDSFSMKNDVWFAIHNS